MPAQWTAEVIGKMHLYGIKIQELAEYLDYHPKYVSMVLNGKKEPIFTAAVDKMIAEKKSQN